MDVTRALLEWLIANGPMTLALVAFICALGAPLPIPLLLIAAGALVRQGHLTLETAIVVTVASVLLGETLYFALGRELGPHARSRLGRRYAAAYDAAERRFRQRPGLTVYVTRWIGSAVSIPVNLIAGAAGFPLRRFILTSVAGNLIWIGGYLSVGYALGNEWRNVSPVLDRYKVWFAAAAVVIGFLFLAYRNRLALLRFLRSTAAPLAPRQPAPETVEIDDARERTR